MFLSLILLATAPASAHERAEGSHAAAELAADQADLATLSRLVDRWETAARVGDLRGQRAADAELMAWIDAELREADREVDKARVEADRARAEARGPGRDDDRDFRDDRGDLAAALHTQERLRSLAAAIRAVQPAFADGFATPGQEAHKAGLLRALEQVARQEVAMSAVELREDGAERREDRYGWAF